LSINQKPRAAGTYAREYHKNEVKSEKRAIKMQILQRHPHMAKTGIPMDTTRRKRLTSHLPDIRITGRKSREKTRTTRQGSNRLPQQEPQQKSCEKKKIII
jgi:hypothetical protein